MKTNYLKKPFTIIALCSLLGACATLDNLMKPRVDNLVVAPDFVPEVYYQESFLIAPAFSTFVDVEFTPSQARLLSNGMQSSFAKKRPEIEVLGHEAGMQSLGLERYLKLSKEFKSTGMLSKSSLTLVAEKTGARYVVFTDLMDDAREEDWSESKQDDHYNVSVTTRRELTAMYTVVDTRAGINSWSGVLKENDSAYKTYQHRDRAPSNYGDATGPLAVLDVLLGEDPRERYREEKDERSYEERFPAPGTDSATTIMSKMHRGFVLSLPALPKEK